MSKAKVATWNTKYGSRRVRREAPTLEEAILAAQGLSDDLNAQVDIAASLIGLPHDEVKVALLKFAPPRKDVLTTVAFTGPASAPRTVVVERKTTRRPGLRTDSVVRPMVRDRATLVSGGLGGTLHRR